MNKSFVDWQIVTTDCTVAAVLVFHALSHGSGI